MKDDLGDDREWRAAARSDVPDVDPLEEARVRALLVSRMLGDEAPVKIGRFVVTARVGSGGMGVVYSAFDPQLDRKVAIKLLMDAGAGETEHARLHVEAKAMARLAHPNVVNVFEVGEHEGRTYVALEYVEGRTLTKWMAERRRSWQEALAMAMQAGRGLASAHDAGIVHRDFKPENVIVGLDERARVLDFGLAYTTSALATGGDEPMDDGPLTRLTRTGARVGTPAYMSPEQIRGEEADALSDQFSFCVATWELLSGERPFAGESVREVFDAVARGRVRKAPRGRIPAQLEAVLRRGIAIERARRFSSMAVLLAALDRAVQRRRWIRGGVVVGAATLAALLAWGIDLRARDQARKEAAAGCELAAAALDSVWNDDARTNVREALVATGVTHAATTAEKLMPWLDAQSSAWRDARLQSCLDREVHRTWDSDTFDRAVWCLDERRLQFESLVAQLGRADADVVHRSVGAAAGLAPVGPCRDVALLARLPVPPVDARLPVAVVRRELARAAALQSANKLEHAISTARDALDGAHELAWPPLVAAAHYRVGVLLDKLGDAAGAERALQSAYFDAGAAAAIDVMADAGIYLVFVLGDRLRRFDDAEVWAQHVRLALRELGDQDGLRTAGYLNVVALNAVWQGDVVRGMRNHEETLAIRQRNLGEGHPEVAASLNNLALAYLAGGDYGAAQSVIERALELKRAAFGPEHPEVAASLGNFADVLLAKGEYEEARELCLRVLAIREAAYGPDHPDVALALNNLANVHDRLGETAAAHQRLARAIEVYERTRGADHPDVAMALGNLGRSKVRVGDNAGGKALLERALRIAQAALGPEDRAVVIISSNLADAELNLGNVERAAELHGRTFRIWEKDLGAEHPDLYYPWMGLARVALARRRGADAVIASEAALRLRTASGDRLELADAKFMLAEGLDLASRDAARALALAEQARDTYVESEHRVEDVRRVEVLLGRLAAPSRVGKR